MHKDQETAGMLFQIVWSKMSVDLVGEQIVLSCLKEIGNSLQTILKNSNLFPEDVISTMQEDSTKHITTVTFSVLKKTLEKNGVLSLTEQ
jgi:hypothetical protein